MKQHRRSWLALLAFCTTTALVTALGFALLIAGATLAFAIGQSLNSGKAVDRSASSRSFSGVITDAHCKARHAMNSGKNPAECTRACVRKGSHYVLVEGDKTYDLKGSRAELDRQAGQRVTVSGALSGDTIQVSSIQQEELSQK